MTKKAVYDDVKHVGTRWRAILNAVAEVEHERHVLLDDRDAESGILSLRLQAEAATDTFARWKILRDEGATVDDMADQLAAVVLSALSAMGTLGVDPTMELTYRLERLSGKPDAGRGDLGFWKAE